MTYWRLLKDVPRDGSAVLLWGPDHPDLGLWSWNPDEECWDAIHEKRPILDPIKRGDDLRFKTARDSDFVLWSLPYPPDVDAECMKDAINKLDVTEIQDLASINPWHDAE